MPESAQFCTECGAKFEAEVKEEVSAAVSAPVETPVAAPPPAVAPPPVTTPPPVTPPVTPSPPVQQVYQPPKQQSFTSQQTPQISKTVGTGAYFGLVFLFAIPLIGFIVCIIMTFAAKNKNIKNFAKATLIWLIIGAVLSGVLFGIGVLLTNTLLDFINDAVGNNFGSFGEVFSEFGEIKDTLGGLGEITSGLESGLGDISNQF